MKSFHCVHSLFCPRSSFDLHFDATSGDLRVFLILVTGQLEIVTLPAATAPDNWESAASVDIAIRNLGASHASDVRSVCFSSDSTALLSASAKSARLWNRFVHALSCQNLHNISFSVLRNAKQYQDELSCSGRPHFKRGSVMKLKTAGNTTSNHRFGDLADHQQPSQGGR